jgi:hypothetical protein
VVLRLLTTVIMVQYVSPVQSLTVVGQYAPTILELRPRLAHCSAMPRKLLFPSRGTAQHPRNRGKVPTGHPQYRRL